ncbi:hypothetical protein [Fulvivirga sedimenti]|uniref:Uncharacterized protein n=1 Tax=Fulvivirga sedimenti TaxID=2879465 RepID=A0A9X1HJW4_9BACT|nr:hypothetical protein [Fulvivirga sedimenti]MCA6073440.1 hypothetical protein [Fulvivirga sedimenti]
MRNILKVLLIAALAWGLSFILPFWGAALAGFIGSMVIRTSNVASFFTGFIAIFLLWGITAFLIDLETQSIMTDRISGIFSLSPPFLILITALIGGITGGLGSLVGCTLRSVNR